MDKELLDLLMKATDKNLTDEEKTKFSHSVGDLISKSEKSIVVMSDKGVACLGRGIDILPTIGLCLKQLIEDRIPDKNLWKSVFELALNEAKVEENDEENEEDEELAEDLLTELKKFNEFLETLKK